MSEIRLNSFWKTNPLKVGEGKEIAIEFELNYYKLMRVRRKGEYYMMDEKGNITYAEEEDMNNLLLSVDDVEEEGMVALKFVGVEPTKYGRLWLV